MSTSQMGQLLGSALLASLLASCSLLFEESQSDPDAGAGADVDANAADPDARNGVVDAGLALVECGVFSNFRVSDFTTIEADDGWLKIREAALVFGNDLGLDLAAVPLSENTAIRRADFHSGALAMDMRVGNIPDDGQAHAIMKLQTETGSDDAAIRVFATTVDAFGPGAASTSSIPRLAVGGDYRVRVQRSAAGDIRMEHSADGANWQDLGVAYNSTQAYSPRFAGSYDADFESTPAPMRLRAVGETCQ